MIVPTALCSATRSQVRLVDAEGLRTVMIVPTALCSAARSRRALGAGAESIVSTNCCMMALSKLSSRVRVNEGGHSTPPLKPSHSV